MAYPSNVDCEPASPIGRIRHFLFNVHTPDMSLTQTCNRLRKALPQLITVDKDSWDDPAMEGRIKASYTRYGVIFCSTKNRQHLQKLDEIMGKYNFCLNEPVFIIDDEADQASLNTEINNEDDEPSVVSAAIQKLRERFLNHRFIQVTATPQALLLQSAEAEFKPDFVVTFPPGKDYVGGEHFFGTSPEKRALIRLIPDSEPDYICREECLLTGFAVPTGFRQAICSFLVGASIKGMQGIKKEFASLFHISHAQSVHGKLATLANSFLESVMNALGANENSAERKQLEQFIVESLADFKSCLSEQLPSFNEVLSFMDAHIGNANVQILNSQNPSTPASGSFFNIFIGGNKLGRGVTIPRLLVTYYGRNSSSPQLDTMLQHARMYGYRAEDLDVIRFYTTPSLCEILQNIHNSDFLLRKTIEKIDYFGDLQAIVLSRTNKGLMRPTRSNVIPLDKIRLYMPGTRYFPYSPQPVNVPTLNLLLQSYFDRKELTQVTVDRLIEFLNLTQAEALPGESWDDEAIRICVQNLQRICNNKGFLAVRIGRNIRKGFRAMLSPDDQKLFDPSAPTLIMYRFEGREKEGWDGKPVWVPNLRFPDGNRYFMFTPT